MADLAEWANTLTPPGIDRSDLRGNQINFFDHYLDGKTVPVPDVEKEKE